MTKKSASVNRVAEHEGNKYVIQDHSHFRLVFRDRGGVMFVAKPEFLCKANWPRDEGGEVFELIGYINTV